MRMTTELRLLPTDPRVLKMTDLQWVAYARFYDAMQHRKARLNLALWTFLLGNSTKDGKIIPFSFFLSEGMQQNFAPLPDEVTEDLEREKVLTDEMSNHLEEVVGVDIDTMLTEEDRKRIANMDLEKLLKEEELAGIIVKNEEKSGG